MQAIAKIIENKQIADGIFDMTVLQSDVASIAMPGQFAHIRVKNGLDPFLRRPISICDVDKERGNVRFVYRRHGKGTDHLSHKKPGEELDMIAPLGQGAYPVDQSLTDIFLIGGGIGSPPLLYAARILAMRGASVHTVLGFSGQDQVILEEDFRQYGSVDIFTMDGSYGKKGLVTDFFLHGVQGMYFACGPKVMLQAVAAHTLLQEATGYLSLEEHMACGVGACMGCVTKVTSDNAEDGEKNNLGKMGGNSWKYAKVCDCGPVFPKERVVF